MKRIFALFLALFLLLPLVSCAKEPTSTQDTGTTAVDLSTLSAAELYAKAVDKMGLLVNYATKTRVKADGEFLFDLSLTRVRTGYDAFDLSRHGDGSEVIYADGTAWVSDPVGSFTAKTSARVMRTLLEEKFYPVLALDPAKVSVLERDGLRVRYESEDKTLLSLYGAIGDTWQAHKICGEATLNEEGVILTEEITVEGTRDGEAATLTLSTETLRFRHPENTVSAPAEGEGNYLTVEDIRTPYLITTAQNALLAAEPLALTVVQENRYQSGDLNISYGVETNLYRKDGLSYLSAQSLYSKVQGQTKEEISRLAQSRMTDGTKTELIHDLFTGTELSRTEAPSDTPLWSKELSALLPKVADFETMKLKEDGTLCNVRFTLKKEEAERYGKERLAAMLPDALLEGEVVLEGTFTVDSVTGTVVALSYSFTAGALSGSFSLTPETEDFTVPELQIPEATTGTEQGPAH